MNARCALLMLLLACLACADQPFSTEAAPPAAEDVVLAQVGILMSIIVPLMMFMLVLAAAAYVGGQIFGAETRARATVWAQGMLAAVGLCAVILAVIYFVLPGLMQGRVATNTQIEELLSTLISLAQMSLAGLIAVFLVLAAAVYAIGQVLGADTRARATGWATALLSGAIVAAVIYVIVFQVLGQLNQTFFAGTGVLIYQQVIIYIAFFVACFILITYLLSKVFKVPEWEAYLNIEMSNLMASFLIVVFILGLFAVGKVVSSAYTGEPSPPQAAIAYMRDVVQYSVFQGMYDVYTIQACTSVLSTFSRRIGEYVLTQTYKVFPGLDTFVSITNVLSMGLITVYGSLSAQITLLYLVEGTMEKLILPAGLILRFFPPTRDAGAFLIALAIGFYIIFPTTYLINKQIFEEIGGTPYPPQLADVTYMCGGSYVVWGIMLSPTNLLFSNIPGGAAMGQFLAQVMSESTIQATYMSYFMPVMRNIAALSLLALFMPALSMVVTMAFINAMTKFIVSKV
ncbi:MAG: hypothetical protein PHV13_01550 [Candidatus ainarchaeum sp.]|nr:hypothetical protein [Candidatus ainarchaeum sp.]